jgi:hypothetical protein
MIGQQTDAVYQSRLSDPLLPHQGAGIEVVRIDDPSKFVTDVFQRADAESIAASVSDRNRG